MKLDIESATVSDLQFYIAERSRVARTYLKMMLNMKYAAKAPCATFMLTGNFCVICLSIIEESPALIARVTAHVRVPKIKTFRRGIRSVKKTAVYAPIADTTELRRL